MSIFSFIYIGGNLISPRYSCCLPQLQSISTFICFAYTDYTQRHAAAMDVVRADFDANDNEVLKTPNFLLMERFLVVVHGIFSKELWKLLYCLH